MPVTRISPEDSEEAKKVKLKEIEKAKKSLAATRKMIGRYFGGPNPND